MDIAKGAGVERIGIISEKMIEEAGGAVGGLVRSIHESAWPGFR